MQFKFLALAAVTAGLVIAAPATTKDVAVAEREMIIAPNTIIASVNAVADTAEDALRIITTLNPITVFFAIPRLVANFGRIVTAVAQDVQGWLSFDGSKPFAVSDQRLIFQAFRRFVQIWIDLLEGLLARFSFLSGTIFLAPISVIIQTIGRGILTFAQGILNFIPEFRQEAVVQQQQLEQTFTIVIERFD